MENLTAKERLAQTAEEMGQQTEVEDLASKLVRLGPRRLVEELLKTKLTERLGRDRYERRSEGAEGYRNGCKRRRLDTAEGRIGVRVPQVRDSQQPFRIELWEAMQWLVVEMYARGLSTRDVEDGLEDLAEGEGSLLGRSSASRVTEVLWEEYEAFGERDLAQLEVVYLLADAVYEPLRQQGAVRRACW